MYCVVVTTLRLMVSTCNKDGLSIVIGRGGGGGGSLRPRLFAHSVLVLLVVAHKPTDQWNEVVLPLGL